MRPQWSELHPDPQRKLQLYRLQDGPRPPPPKSLLRFLPPDKTLLTNPSFEFSYVYFLKTTLPLFTHTFLFLFWPLETVVSFQGSMCAYVCIPKSAVWEKTSPHLSFLINKMGVISTHSASQKYAGDSVRWQSKVLETIIKTGQRRSDETVTQWQILLCPLKKDSHHLFAKTNISDH